VEQIDRGQLLDRYLDGVERGEHPLDHVRSGSRIVGQEGFAALGDVEDDRARFEQREVSVLDRRNLAEWLDGAIGGHRHRAGTIADQRRTIGPACLLEGPAHAQVADQPLREGGYGAERITV
jgi:hypothetical protein